jgi:hypothetical protein
VFARNRGEPPIQKEVSLASVFCLPEFGHSRQRAKRRANHLSQP